MNFHIKNYSKSTPIKWQLIGDLALLLIPVLISFITDSHWDPILKTNLIFWLSLLLAIIKVLTQFFAKKQ